jgi:hypothetical protein
LQATKTGLPYSEIEWYSGSQLITSKNTEHDIYIDPTDKMKLIVKAQDNPPLITAKIKDDPTFFDSIKLAVLTNGEDGADGTTGGPALNILSSDETISFTADAKNIVVEDKTYTIEF